MADPIVFCVELIVELLAALLDLGSAAAKPRKSNGLGLV
jgi:hypothetical protein